MVNSTNNTNQAQQAKQAETVKTAPGAAVNPKSKLDGQAFMKLLLTELKYQDPTQPMDSEKMLAQTSQLATLETQESTNKLMKELAQQLKEQTKSGANAYAISAIGKIADMGDVKLAVDDKSTRLAFELYLEKPVKSGTITIKDKDDKVIRTQAMEEGKSGVEQFVWDLKNSSGARVPNGAYKVSVNYKDKDGKEYKSELGKYPVEGVKFKEGKALLKLGSKYIPMTDIKEFTKG